MRSALEAERWNLAVRRAQEVVEPVVKGLLSALGVEYPRTHDPAPLLVSAIRRHGWEADPGFLDWLAGVSDHLAEMRSPAFYHEIEVGEDEARSAVEAADRVLAFGTDLLARLRGS